ncbi:hypothetical protein AVU39_gp33 [Sulfolobus monocaudavirus SMV2]|uniref:hypothetical protein n=1 Tax=Sulfolobus monocaudavirus SMV2 TaxID=1580591 RepID=UPI0006D2E9EB|nr:hypothetical protein AVU39_gp33 [Sulfolobus monocaudavirus SMV2]AIZ11367.1 hypothetical protein [Sulfolobus monocaudavirus SMV2]
MDRNTEEAMKIINRVTDEKLKEILSTYIKSKDPNILLEILKYFHIKVDRDSINGIVPDYWAEGDMIMLGSIIMNGELFWIFFYDFFGFYMVFPIKVDITVLG